MNEVKAETRKYIEDVVFSKLHEITSCIDTSNELIFLLEEKIEPFLFNLEEPVAGVGGSMSETPTPQKVLDYLDDIKHYIVEHNKRIEKILKRTEAK